MSQPEFHTGHCELCSKSNHPENLYVDLFNNMYSLICPECFYKRNQDKDKEYYHRILETVPDVLSYKRFKQENKDLINIGNTYPYFKENGLFMSDMEKAGIVDNTLKHFFGLEKIKRKFKVIKAQSKCSEQISNGGVIFLVAVVAKVRFNSYLEYMEHHLYKKFKAECPTILR